MRPLMRFSCMWRPSACARMKAALRLTSSISRHCASLAASAFSASWRRGLAACTKIDTRPRRLIASCARRAASPGCDRSASGRSAPNTRAPSSASAAAMPRPMPPPAPVTRALSPSSSLVFASMNDARLPSLVFTSSRSRMSILNRERVLRAATSSFLAHGYGSSVDVIARRAGVAKQTVYHHFPSKDELSKEVARDLTKRVLGAQGIATFRAVVPEVPRFRALARAMYAASAGETVRRLAAYLESAMQAGELRRDDPTLAAELLLGMLVGHDRVKRLFGVPLAEGDARRAARVVECFLRAYKP